jgi:hypothetical protein
MRVGDLPGFTGSLARRDNVKALICCKEGLHTLEHYGMIIHEGNGYSYGVHFSHQYSTHSNA